MAVKGKRADAQKSRYENGMYREKNEMLNNLRTQKFAQLDFSESGFFRLWSRNMYIDGFQYAFKLLFIFLSYFMSICFEINRFSLVINKMCLYKSRIATILVNL